MKWTSAELNLTKEKNRRQYPGEKIPLIEIFDEESLGRIACLNFFIWLEQGNLGLIALATGSTPKSFFKHLAYYLSKQNKNYIREELYKFGIKGECFKNISKIHLVQLDEYFPLLPHDRRSFHYLIKHSYLKCLKLPLSRALLIDFTFLDPNIDSVFPLEETSSLKSKNLSKKQRILANKLKEYCYMYEEKIKRLGGINFFIGGLGPDGHIAFNLPGSSHKSVTKIATLNHSSSAYAASTFGGYSKSSKMTIMTIGLKSITRNPDCFSMILVSGRNKADILEKSLTSSSCKKFPLTAFQSTKNTRILATTNACINLPFRKKWNFRKNTLLPHINFLFNACLKYEISISKMTKEALRTHPQSDTFFKTLSVHFSKLKDESYQFIDKLIENGHKLNTSSHILHTAPHHDDIFLAYYPFVKQLNSQSFLYITNGHRGVADLYIQNQALKARSYLFRFDKCSTPLKIYQCLKRKKGFHANSTFLMSIFEAKAPQTMLQLLNILSKLSKLEYSTPDLVKLKIRIRENEANRIWNSEIRKEHSIMHFNARIYHNKSKDCLEKEILRMQEVIEEGNYRNVTVICDPFELGPKSHHESFTLLYQALLNIPKIKRPKLYAYRNVWSQFSIAQASHLLYFSEEEMRDMEAIFKRGFSSQYHADFPSPYQNKNFAKISIDLFRKQWNEICTLSGTSIKHSILKNSHGGVAYLKELPLHASKNYIQNGDF